MTASPTSPERPVQREAGRGITGPPPVLRGFSVRVNAWVPVTLRVRPTVEPAPGNQVVPLATVPPSTVRSAVPLEKVAFVKGSIRNPPTPAEPSDVPNPNVPLGALRDMAIPPQSSP